MVLGNTVIRRPFLIFCGVVSLLGGLFLGYVFYLRIQAFQRFQHEVELLHQETARIQQQYLLSHSANTAAPGPSQQ